MNKSRMVVIFLVMVGLGYYFGIGTALAGDGVSKSSKDIQIYLQSRLQIKG